MEKKYIDLDKKIQSMTAKEIILAMVDSLKNPAIKVDMGSYGHKEKGICYGCAATNTILKLGNLDANEEINHADGPLWRMPEDYTQTDFRAVHWFERAINALRCGDIISYNIYANKIGAAKIVRHADKVPHLPLIENWNYFEEEVLQKYIDLANAQ